MKDIKFDPYAVLGLVKDCTDKDIQKAYKAQCLKWHPDKNRNNEEEAQRKFILAKEAFEFLYDNERRTVYDRKSEAVRVRDEKQRERMAQADDRRRKFMEDLKERENKFAQEQKKADELTPTQLAQKRKIEEKRVKSDFEDLARRLFKEAEQELSVRNEKLQKDLAEEKRKAEAEIAKLRVRWNRKHNLGADYFRSCLRQFGTITDISPIREGKKERNLCIVEFSSITPAGLDLKLSEADKNTISVNWEHLPKKMSNLPGLEKDIIVIDDEEEDKRTSTNFEEMSYDDLLASFDAHIEEKRIRQ